MKKRFGEILCIAVVLFVLAVASPVKAQTTQTLLASGRMSSAQEVNPNPPVPPNASGQFTALFTVNRDATGAITSATVQIDASFTLPAPTTVVAGHFHEGAAGTNGGVRIDFGVGSSPLNFATGTGTFSKLVTITGTGLAALERLIANPAGFYINFHSTVNPAGVVRGQLTTPLALTKVGSSIVQTECFRSSEFYVRNLRGGFGFPRTGLILIPGVNGNNPENIATPRGLNAVLDALTGGTGSSSFGNAQTPYARFAREFVTAQLNLISSTDPTISNGVLSSQLGRYGLIVPVFVPVVLSNNFAITNNSPLGDVFEQARNRNILNSSTDMEKLANILEMLNGNDPLGKCR